MTIPSQKRVYVDFKNWKLSYIQDREKTINEILRKLEAIGGKRVYIINIIGDRNHQGEKAIDSKIVEIPGLLDSEGRVINGALDLIYKEDYE